MLLIGLDGTIRSDTANPPGDGQQFPFPDLADAALERPAAAVVAMDGKAYWMIVAPVYAPEPIALIAAGIPVDNPLLTRLQQLSALPNTIELVTDSGNGHWTDIARGNGDVALAAALTAAGHSLPLQPTLVRADGREFVALATRLRESQRSAPVAAVLGYSLDDALRPLSLGRARLGESARARACGGFDRRDADRAKCRATDRGARSDRASRRVRRLLGDRSRCTDAAKSASSPPHSPT